MMFKIILKYIKALFKNLTFILTGIFSFAIAVIIDFTSEEFLWVIYVLALSFSVIVAGFKLYKEMYMEIQELKSEIARCRLSTPVFDIKVKVNEEKLGDACLFLNTIPPKPDIESLVSEEKKSSIIREKRKKICSF